MPKQVLFDQASFEAFARALKKRDFRPITWTEFTADFGRLDLRAPSPRTGSEAGFVFSANGLSVVVWTTFVLADGQPRKIDAGWVLIKEKDKPLYFNHPLHRTRRFLYRLLERAAIARERVLHRPQCPECGKFMNITYGRAIKSRYWSCRHQGGKVVNLPWDHGLSEAVLERIKLIRAERQRYRRRVKKEGENPQRALFSRTGWKVGKPENRLP